MNVLFGDSIRPRLPTKKKGEKLVQEQGERKETWMGEGNVEEYGNMKKGRAQ